MASKKFLSREEILGAQDIPVEEIHVPEWGGYVRVKGMTGAERDAFEGEIVESRGKDRKLNLRNIRAKLVARTAVDDAGQYLFTEDDIKALGRKSAAALQRVFDKAQELSGMSEKDVEELAGNSEGDPSDDSTSG